MGISVTELRKQLTGGGARPSLFFANVDFKNVKENLGAVTKGILDDSTTNMSFFMKGAQIPDSTLNPIPINFLGREFKVPSTDRVFQDWTVTVINDEDFRIRHVFEAWIEYITPGKAIFETAKAFGGSSSIFCNMSVHQMGKGPQTDNKPGPVKYKDEYLGSYFFRDAFPTAVSGIELNWDQKDVIEEFTVTFAYQYWEKLSPGDAATELASINPFAINDTNSWLKRDSTTTSTSTANPAAGPQGTT